MARNESYLQISLFHFIHVRKLILIKEIQSQSATHSLPNNLSTDAKLRQCLRLKEAKVTFDLSLY